MPLLLAWGVDLTPSTPDRTTIRIEPATPPWEPEVIERLRAALARCPDVAFAHLPQVYVPEHQDHPEMVLFVWLLPGALRSLRQALNTVSEIVAHALPDDDYLDVVILNSAPELLERVERAGCLLVDRVPEERSRARNAAARSGEPEPEVPAGRTSPWWWPF